jgi:hypothetical protein
MLKFIALAAGLMLASAASAQQSLQAMHARVPAPPATAAAAPAWLASPEITTLRKQLKDQRTFIENLSKQAGADAQPTASRPAASSTSSVRSATGIRPAGEGEDRGHEPGREDEARHADAAGDQPERAEGREGHGRRSGCRDRRSRSLRRTTRRIRSTMRGIQAQYAAVADIQRRVSARATEIAAKAGKALKCSDGEGGCASAADQAADKATLKAAFDQITAEYDKALPAIAQQVEAARKSRLADITAAQRDLGPAQYGAAAQSTTNRQLLAAYHNAVLMEIEQLFILSEDTAKWAAVRFKDRTINFTKID